MATRRALLGVARATVAEAEADAFVATMVDSCRAARAAAPPPIAESEVEGGEQREHERAEGEDGERHDRDERAERGGERDGEDGERRA